jgi:DNA mismatch repair protein PMS2
MDNIEIFRKNGFHMKIDPDSLPGHKLKLTAVPFSKKTQFTAEDIRELADNLMTCGEKNKETIRPKKIQTMFASRACRKSIMVGRALERSEQIRVVRNLATMDQPWNCPHGRPTLQHMFMLTK